MCVCSLDNFLVYILYRFNRHFTTKKATNQISGNGCATTFADVNVLAIIGKQ